MCPTPCRTETIAMIKCFVPTTVAPSKLDLLLAELHPQPLSSEKRTKVSLLKDIIRLYKLLGLTVTPKGFYLWYDESVEMLEMRQHNLQVDYNTMQYRSTIEGHDF